MSDICNAVQAVTPFVEASERGEVYPDLSQQLRLFDANDPSQTWQNGVNGVEEEDVS